MPIRICSYNIEWFDNLFTSSNNLRIGNNNEEEEKRLEAIRDVLSGIDADLIGVLEAPNTVKSGTKSTVACLEAFAQWAGLRTSKALVGIPSGGKQEIAVLYDPAKLKVKHIPSKSRKKSNPAFTGTLEIDTDEDRIKELYKFYRPPLEAQVSLVQRDYSFRLMAVHPKSKGIFDPMDRVHWEKEAERNRRKLFAECYWIRLRIEEWLGGNHEVIVMGDFNDGPAMDFFEHRFGKSAFELVMGDLFAPDQILRNYVGKPKWTKWGWEPSSASFRSPIDDKKWVNVLIDHILISPQLKIVDGSATVWNPYVVNEAKPLKKTLWKASDHYPVIVDLNI